jgi:hypothetical protein
MSKTDCLRCGRTKADEKRDPGPCIYGFKRHIWGKWRGQTIVLPINNAGGIHAPESMTRRPVAARRGA